MTDAYGKAQILVLDDERLIRMTLSAKLRLIGYTPVAVGTIDEALAILNDGGYRQFMAVITDIMMGGMDGFVFRDILRGMDATMPIFFLTALDPEEGGSFLKKIMEDANSYYLPKAVRAEVLLKRVQSIVASRRVEQFIDRQMTEARQAMTLSAQVQRSMLPRRALITDRGFYTTWWQPKDIVSGDLYEAVPFGNACYLYVLGDIQGHGISASLAMTAVQAFLKQMTHRDGTPSMGPAVIANMLQKFFRESLADISYMTALICIHRAEKNEVEWLSCGAPDLEVIDPLDPNFPPSNPENRGGMPIGLLPDTVYTQADVVTTKLTNSAICVAYTDGILDLARDPEGLEQMPDSQRERIRDDLLIDARLDGSIIASPYKFMEACRAYGYDNYADDVTELVFGARFIKPGVFEATVPIIADEIDRLAQRLAAWCSEQNWDIGAATRTQLVFEEKMMNLHDHGFDEHERFHEVACVRLRRRGPYAELTIWDCGTPDPSIEVAAGSTDIAFKLKNQEFSGRGRGRLMIREICKGIERNRYGTLNETIYSIPMEESTPGEGA